jgi:transcriptional regulator with XRE-family HTH domain
VSRPNIYQIVGETIRTRRRRAHLSQEKLAEKTNLNRNYIGEIERAEKNITLETLEKIAKALDLRVGELLDDL